MSSSRKVLAVWSMANITNLLGMLGVIGSLIFVGIEIRQNQEIYSERLPNDLRTTPERSPNDPRTTPERPH